MSSAKTSRYSLLVLLWLTNACIGNRLTQSTSNNNNTGNSNTTQAPAVPFAPLSLHAASRKVKTLLTGQAVTTSEYAALDANPNALESLVQTWQQSPAYQTVMQAFFADAFQQNLAGIGDYRSNNGYFYPTSGGVLNLRDSFAKTALQFVTADTPFTQVATTHTFMMTTAQMAHMANQDMQWVDDNGILHNHWLDLNPNFHFVFQDYNSSITLDQTVDPNSSYFGVVYYPGLSSVVSSDPNCPFDGNFIITPQNVTNSWTFQMFVIWTNNPLSYFTPTHYFCSTTKRTGWGLNNNDLNDWRAVTIRQPNPGEYADTFFNLPHLRSTNTLVLNAPHVGYFSTLPFMTVWETNGSNQFRVTVNQAMIVGLGQAFDGTSGNEISGIPPGLDPNHADPSSACYACHRNMDPMREFFIQHYNFYNSPQTNPNELGITPTFAFNTAPVQGLTLDDLGQQIGNNPGFAAAWTQKLCVWANSTPCNVNDPEFIHVAQVFANSNFSWNTLVRTLMTSPLVTYMSDTLSADATGGMTSIARRNHLCNTLNQRLGIGDLCKQSTQIAATTGLALTSSLPMDIVVRGAAVNVPTSLPNLNYRAMLENVCVLAANTVVDTKGMPSLSSSDPNTAIAFLTTNLMGVSPDEAPPFEQVLQDHYNQALAASSVASNPNTTPADIALKSTFVAACMTPLVSSIGF